MKDFIKALEAGWNDLDEHTKDSDAMQAVKLGRSNKERVASGQTIRAVCAEDVISSAT